MRGPGPVPPSPSCRGTAEFGGVRNVHRFLPVQGRRPSPPRLGASCLFLLRVCGKRLGSQGLADERPAFLTPVCWRTCCLHLSSRSPRC